MGKKLKEDINKILELENAAYRILGDEIAEITSEHEIEAVESALSISSRAIETHISRALEFLSDRKQPDYRNSIKESISAVESACQALCGNEGATLSNCLTRIKEVQYLHPAFEKALHKLYGYTSDSGGIRHALLDKTVEVTYAEAKFMLVACSAFVNFLLTQSTELKLESE